MVNYRFYVDVLKPSLQLFKKMQRNTIKCVTVPIPNVNKTIANRHVVLVLQKGGLCSS
jgi:hypothetical protein